MEQLEDSILKFHPDTLEKVRKEFDLDKPQFINQSIDLLEKWLKDQNHFVKRDFAREYLERILISSKGSVEKAKVKLDKSCTVKSLLSQYFETLDAKIDIAPYNNLILCSLLPQLTNKQERVFILKNNNYSGSTGFLDIYRYLIKVAEYLKANDYNSGVIVILDYSTLYLPNLISKMNIVELNHIMDIIVGNCGLRMSKLYIISPSKMIDSVVTMFKQVMPNKLAQRIQVYKDYKKLQEDLPIKILPKDYEGQEKCIEELHENLLQALTTDSFVEHLKEMKNATTNEAYRDSSKFNDTYLGTPGSFRQICVD